MTCARVAFDASVYLVTDTGMCAERGVTETVRAAVAGGVRTVQLRDPHADDAAFVAGGRELAAALRGTGVALIVNDRVELVTAIGADGAHVGQTDTDPQLARELLGPRALLGLSVGNLAELQNALDAQVDVDYLGVGPVWAQRTKPDAGAPCGVDGLRAIVDASPWPVVAIGGIDATRTPEVRATGARGVAVVSAVCAAPDPRAAAAAIARAWTS